MTILLSRGYRFDGVDDAVDLGQSVAPGVTFTMEGWWRLAPHHHGTVFGATLMGRWTPGSGALLYYTPAGKLRGYVNGLTVESPSSVAVGPWVHLAFVRDGVNGTLYIDGVAVATSAGLPAAAPTYPAQPFWLGAYGATANESLSGFARDVRLWSTALAAADLGAFRPSLRGDEAGLVGWWPLDGDTLDRSRNGLHGTAKNGARPAQQRAVA